MVIDANVGNNLMEQLLVEHFQRLFQLVNQGFQLSDIFQHGENLGLKAAVSLGFQFIELLADLPRLRMVNICGEVSLCAKPLQCKQLCVQFGNALTELAGRSVVPLIGCGGKFQLLNRLTKDIFFAKAQLVDHGDDAVVNTFLTVIVGIAGGCVCCVSGADPFDRSVPHLPMIESAALGTPNAACKRVF